MQMLSRILLTSLALTVVVPHGSERLLRADPPSIFSIFQRKQSVSEADLQLQVEHGPYLVLATYLTGNDAQTRAIQLAKEIRQSMNLASFVYEKTFDNSAVLGQTTQVIPELDGTTTQYRAQRRYANGVREQVYAVLVGEFTTMDDPKIEGVLQSIKSAEPRSLAADDSAGQSDKSEGENSNWLVQKYRSVMWAHNDRTEKLGPMGKAFVIRNPMLPSEYFLDAPKVDQFVAKLNKNVEHSLLQCKGKYTVRVASFTGKEVTDFGNGARASKMSDEPTSALDRAALKAHKLTTALRKDGVEAYEFHDKYGSYVAVGSFDSLGREVAGGDFQYNPEMMAVATKYCGYENVQARDRITGAEITATSLKSKDKIPFDLEGKPMAVPRVATRAYGGSLLGRR